MTLTFFTPGPGKLHPEFERWMSEALKDSIPSISHRSRAFEAIFESTVLGLKKLLSLPDAHQIFFLGSGTEAMERIIQNVVERSSFHFVNGAFSERFFQIAEELGKEPKCVKASLGSGFDFKKSEIPKDTELLCITQNETSTGVWIPPHAITELGTTHPDTLIAIDFVSSAPIVDLNFQKIDCAFFSVQKCFGLPAGLGVLIVSPRALSKSEALRKIRISTGSYHSFQSLLSFGSKHQTPETPPVLEIFLLNKVIASFSKTDLSTLRTQVNKRAEALYSLPSSPLVKESIFRSSTVVCLETPNASQVTKKLLDKGIVVGEGYGALKEKTIRIANFPVHTNEEHQRLLEALSQVI